MWPDGGQVSDGDAGFGVAPGGGSASRSWSSDAAFDAAFPRLLAVAYRVAYRILGDREDARDVASETLARALVRWSMHY